jgi:hypothetical protein
MEPTSAVRGGTLTGWKEIAAHLGTTVRTARRWEGDLELPVHRVHGPSGEIVVARIAELETWKGTSAAAQDGRQVLCADAEADASGSTASGHEGTVRPLHMVGRTVDPHPRRFSRPVVWSLSLGLLAVACGAAVVLWTSHLRPGAGSASPRLSGRELLDKGPWPTQGHDSRRTGQSHLAGPANGGPIRLLREERGTLSWDPGVAGADSSPVVARSDGTLVFGTCGSVSAIDLTGGTAWTRRLADAPIHEGVAGLAASAGGVLVVTTHECPALASTRTHIYGLDGAGAVLWSRVVGETYTGAALGPRGAWYTVSDSNLVRGFGPSSVEPVWMTDLAGDRHSAITLDASGNLYIGTNGGEYHRPSFWSLAPDGAVRWAVEDGTVTTPVVSEGDRVYVAGNGALYAFDTKGRRLWSADIGPLAGSWSPLAVGRSGAVYALTTAGLAAVAPDGRVRWTVAAGDGPDLSPGPVLDKDENVYVGLGNSVRSFTREGRPRWATPVAAPGQMIIAADGVLCVVGERHKIYAIGAAR